ncbi:MAG: formate dehydrogenase accessory sulfurtransferase FdhD [Acidobacteria bacterium]|nr:formate dehydrogenase accessory sulfurtransferase FdhD [Acidobacteriota bacterium]
MQLVDVVRVGPPDGATGAPTPPAAWGGSVRRGGPGGAVERHQDVAAAEEPLEIRLQGSPFVVTMRTPGADRELAVGLLVSERVIAGLEDIGTIRHCERTTEEGEENVLDVTLVGAAAARADAALLGRRLVTTTSACGVCGRRSIDELMQDVPPVTGGWVMAAAVVAALPKRLRGAQAVFDETGGLHAAGLFDPHGTLVAVVEDVGRHNAVDKVIGAQLVGERWPLGDLALFVSGRTSFEIVQKAVVAGIPIVGAVSAPSSLAIELARAAGVTLLGFVRGDTFNIYTGEERIVV